MPGKNKSKIMKMRNGKTAKAKTKKLMAGMKTASGASRAGESGRKRPMVPDAGKPMQAKPKKPMKKKNSGIAPAMPSGGGPLGMLGGGKSGKKAKTMKKGKKVKVNKSAGKRLEMRGMMNGGKVENFQDYVKRVFGGS